MSKQIDLFMDIVKAAKARKTEFKCKYCKMNFYRNEDRGFCLCFFGPATLWRAYSKYCYQCRTKLSTVFENSSIYQSKKNQEFIMVNYEEWEENFKPYQLCELCAKLPYAELIKKKIALMEQANEDQSNLNGLSIEKRSLQRRLEDVEIQLDGIDMDRIYQDISLVEQQIRDKQEKGAVLEKKPVKIEKVYGLNVALSRAVDAGEFITIENRGRR